MQDWPIQIKYSKKLSDKHKKTPRKRQKPDFHHPSGSSTSASESKDDEKTPV